MVNDSPISKYNVILDTDIENEIDDKFALVYLLKSLDIFNIKAITIAPFYGSFYSSVKPNTWENAKIGVEKSYHTALEIMDMIQVDYKDKVFKGSTGFIERGYNEDNDAINAIIETVHHTENTYIIAIAGLTNIALALRKDPSIAEKMTVIWLGGNSLLYKENDEFNYRQDKPAVKEVFEKVSNFIVIPCIHVASQLVTTKYELEHYLQDRGKIGKYLCNEYIRCKPEKVGKSKTIWDISAIAYLINENWFEKETMERSYIDEDDRYYFDNNKKNITFVKRVSRDHVFGDFFSKI